LVTAITGALGFTRVVKRDNAAIWVNDTNGIVDCIIAVTIAITVSPLIGAIPLALSKTKIGEYNGRVRTRNSYTNWVIKRWTETASAGLIRTRCKASTRGFESIMEGKDEVKFWPYNTNGIVDIWTDARIRVTFKPLVSTVAFAFSVAVVIKGECISCLLYTSDAADE